MDRSMKFRIILTSFILMLVLRNVYQYFTIEDTGFFGYASYLFTFIAVIFCSFDWVLYCKAKSNHNKEK